jgi:hypothetical protein
MWVSITKFPHLHTFPKYLTKFYVIVIISNDVPETFEYIAFVPSPVSPHLTLLYLSLHNYKVVTARRRVSLSESPIYGNDIGKLSNIDPKSQIWDLNVCVRVFRFSQSYISMYVARYVCFCLVLLVLTLIETSAQPRVQTMPVICAFGRPTTQRVASSVRSSIPPELTDRVIDFLHNDWESLKSCCLTCKAWLPASRYHLWHRVVLRFTGNDDERAYADFLKSSPIITSCIVDLTVEFVQSCRSSARKSESDWIQGTLIPIFSTLRFLRRLMFINARFRAEDDEKAGGFLSSIVTKLSSVRALQFSLCHFAKFSQYVELVWGCPNLETLRLDNVTFDTIDTYLPRPPAVPRLHLKFLMIIFYSSHMPTVIEWLISEGLCSHLDFLVVFQLQVESPAVRRLLPVIGSHLRHLSISYAFLPVQPGTENGKSFFPQIPYSLPPPPSLLYFFQNKQINISNPITNNFCF